MPTQDASQDTLQSTQAATWKAHLSLQQIFEKISWVASLDLELSFYLNICLGMLNSGKSIVEIWNVPILVLSHHT